MNPTDDMQYITYFLTLCDPTKHKIDEMWMPTTKQGTAFLDKNFVYTKFCFSKAQCLLNLTVAVKFVFEQFLLTKLPHKVKYYGIFGEQTKW